MVKKEENGYTVNGQRIDARSAIELMSFVENEFYREDVIEHLNDQYGEELTEKIPENLLDEIVDRYAKSREDSENWRIHIDEAISEHKSEIEAIQNQSAGKEIAPAEQSREG